MASAVRNALIVGGGPAGLTTAIVLNKRGIKAEIVELNDELRPLGSGLSMNGASLRALRLVDEELARRCIQEGEGHAILNFGTVDGTIVQQIELPQVAGPDYPAGFGIMRPVFWGLLAEAAQEAGTRIRLSTTITAVEQDGDGATVETSDGSREKYDLVVGADGLHSSIREVVFPDVPSPFFTGQTVWRAVVPRPDHFDEHLGLWYGPRNKAGVTPVSREEMYVFVVENTPQLTRPPRENWPEMLRALLAEYGGLIGWARGQMTDPERIDRRPLHALLVPPPWHRDRVLLIGDAAHATTPHLASGVAIATEDAVVLGQVLESNDSLNTALGAFLERRYERCRLVVENSLQLGEWEKHPDDPAADPAGLSNASLAALATPF